jgi:aerobic carbon-monoxide dehydrogenase large subunit
VTAVRAATAGRFVGHAVPRKEDPRLLTGRGRYVDDVRLPGMLFLGGAQVGARITDQPLTPVRARAALSALEAT